MNEPETLIDAVRYYADRKTCFETMLSVKWPDGKITCPKCHGELIGKIESRSMLQCKLKVCRKQFSVKVGTIFEDSPIGLDRWFVAVWCIANAKNGISSHELGRALGITQKTAWFMLHRVREAMKTPTFRKLEGEVESDETFIGGRAANMHKAVREKKIKGRGASGKAETVDSRDLRFNRSVPPGAIPRRTGIPIQRPQGHGWQQVQRCPVCRRGATINLQTPHCPRGCWLHGDSMSKTKALLAKLVQVPKKEVDRRVKRKKPKRKGK